MLMVMTTAGVGEGGTTGGNRMGRRETAGNVGGRVGRRNGGYIKSGAEHVSGTICRAHGGRK